VETIGLLWIVAWFAAPFLIPFLIVVAAPNRWIFAASIFLVPAGLFAWADNMLSRDPGPAGIAIMPMLPIGLVGLACGVTGWIMLAFGRRLQPVSRLEVWLTSGPFYVVATALTALATWPMWKFW
jgi:hypothetical protein